jgi:aspartyl-tRNA(Asn)/glutamyl-tRNA(Gln) amidotransferase subunit A
VGPIARSVGDVRLLLMAAAGRAPDGATQSAAQSALGSMRLGVLPESDLPDDVHPEIVAAYGEAIRQLERLGARVSEMRGLGSETATAAVRVILNAEAYAGHSSSLRKHPELYGASARIHLTQGAFLSAADYIHALRYLSRYTAVIDSMFDTVDCLLTPTAPYLTAEEARRPDTHRRGGGDVFTSPFNLSGNPAVSVPAGFSGSGLPIGVQMVARQANDDYLLWVAEQFERATPWHERHPAIALDGVE